MPIHKKNPTPPLTVNMSPQMRKYYRDRTEAQEIGDKTKKNNQNEFLFDDELHKEMQNAILGYNPYQE